MNSVPNERIAFATIWHQLPFEDLRELVQHAEGLGYEAAYLDGDVGFVPSLGDADVLDGWTVQTALAAATARIRFASIRLVHHWNAFRLAQAVATFERISPGRQRVLVSVGGQHGDKAIGLPFPGHKARVAWLDETLSAARRLWTGEAVDSDGDFVRLDGARLRPPLLTPPFVEVGGASNEILDVVARHADGWNVNRPVIPGEIARVTSTFQRACDRAGRDPSEVERSLWFFARPDQSPAEALKAYRRFAPWFRHFTDRDLAPGLLHGSIENGRQALAAASQDLALDLPVIDVTGLPLSAAKETLDGFAPRHKPASSAS